MSATSAPIVDSQPVALLRITRGRRRLDDQRVDRLHIPTDPHFDDGNCAAECPRNLSLTASIQVPQLDNSVIQAALSDWRLVGGFRATTGPWLTITTGADIALNGQAGTQRANQLRDDP